MVNPSRVRQFPQQAPLNSCTALDYDSKAGGLVIDDEKDVVGAFDCHGAISTQQEEPSVSENDPRVHSKVKKSTATYSKSNPVAYARSRFPDKHLRGSCTTLECGPEAGTLVFQDVNKPRVKPGSNALEAFNESVGAPTENT
ncbi:MAG: hypothetical protein L6R35_004690 [Caloplaca aegaea]|nr:MAG: hypothetical protein L6R35_004690 [Caloplaca aegaea]